jgi:hypothetical protein
VQVEQLSHIPGGMVAIIASLLRKMLVLDPSQRMDASRLLDGWLGVFDTAVERAHDLNGNVF